MNKSMKLAESTDLEELHHLMEGIVGKTCWRVSFTYGDELCLHFGRRLSYDIPMMKGKKKGAWILGTRASQWQVFTPAGSVSSVIKEKLEERAKILEGRRVTRVNVGVPDNILIIAFGNEYIFQVTPRSNAKSNANDLPYWELFSPDHKIIIFGPGASWLCGPSDMPIKQNRA